MLKFSQFWGPLEPWKDHHQFGIENVQITIKQVILNTVFVPGIYELLGLKWHIWVKLFLFSSYTNAKQIIL